jgi:DNA-binding LacI/PurR family transcriptional regulator
MYPILATFACCCASAGEIVARRIVASTAQVIFLLIGFLPSLFSPFGRALTLALSQRAREKGISIQVRKSKIEILRAAQDDGS